NLDTRAFFLHSYDISTHAGAVTKTLAWDLLSREQDSVLGFAFFDVNFGAQLHNYDATGIGMCVLMNHARDNGALQFCIAVVCAVCFWSTQARADVAADSQCRNSRSVRGRLIKPADRCADGIRRGNGDTTPNDSSIYVPSGRLVFFDGAA